MKILFASWPGYGHLLPMVPLIRAAQRGGHDVVVSSGRDMSEVIARLGVVVHISGITMAESYARMPGDLMISQMPPAEQSRFAGRHLFGAGAVDRARDLLDLVKTWRPDLVVHDTLELGSPVAAEASGIPHITHGYGPMVPDNASLVTEIGAAIQDAGTSDPVPGVFTAPYLDIAPPALRRDGTKPWRRVRPLRPSAGEVGPDTSLPSKLSALPYPDSISVTLGTVMNQAPEVFRAVIEGCSRLPVNVIVTTGPEFDNSLLGPLQSAGFSAPFLPQAAVLPHCTAVVSHAGAGTMLGALCHGLPQLCLPQGTDQPFNAAALVPTGAALALQPEQVTPGSVTEALGRLLREPSFRQAANRLRGEIDQMPDADTVLEDILTDRPDESHC
jgi:UDP:flavonoid glycosyltransferase YjiC (YdhE family)